MGSAKGVREVSHFDCAGGGQIIVDKGIAYIGHMASPHGTTIVDVRDPKHPRRLAELPMPAGTHSHKVRVSNGVMGDRRSNGAMGDLRSSSVTGLAQTHWPLGISVPSSRRSVIPSFCH